MEISVVIKVKSLFSYKLDLSEVVEGNFVLPLSGFLSKSSQAAFDGRDLIWIGFNFNDTLGGIIYFDDCELSK